MSPPVVQARGITIADATRAIKARIRDIDTQIIELRAEQRGLEKALNIVLGQSSIPAEGY